jgi:hypothetical protein
MGVCSTHSFMATRDIMGVAIAPSLYLHGKMRVAAKTQLISDASFVKESDKDVSSKKSNQLPASSRELIVKAVAKKSCKSCV